MTIFSSSFSSSTAISSALSAFGGTGSVLDLVADDTNAILDNIHTLSEITRSYSNTTLTTRLSNGHTYTLTGSGFISMGTSPVSSINYTSSNGSITIEGDFSYFPSFPNDTLSGTLGKLTIEYSSGLKVTINGSGNLSFADGFDDISVTSAKLALGTASLTIQGDFSLAGDGTLSGTIANLALISGDNTFSLSGMNLDAADLVELSANGSTFLNNLLAGNDSLDGTIGNDFIAGLSGNDTINGLAGHDSLTGGDGNDSLLGGDGNDTLDGGSGNDTLEGGNGNDTYMVNSSGDVINEISPTGGTDTIKLVSGFTGNLDLTGSYVENVDGSVLNASTSIAISGNNLANSIIGGSGQDTLSGSAGNDTINSAAGNDTLNGEDGDDALDGGTGDDVLNGGEGNDTLTGGTGTDTLIGGNGDDLYSVAIKSQIVLGSAVAILEDSIADTGSGNDTIRLTGSVKLTTASTLSLSGDLANIENMDASATGATLLNLTGNAQNNILLGNSAANTLLGEDGNDSLNGDTGNDSLNGGDGDDTLYGGIGADTMNGGDGNDTYSVDNIADVIIDSGGVDTLFINLSSGTFALADEVEIENIYASGKANINFRGNALNNTINGNDGANKLEGLGGDDEITGGLGNDTLYGGDGIDHLSGGAGNDMLDGGSGADSMQGDGGNDTYMVDDDDDEVIEDDGNPKTGGIDTVMSSISYTLGDNLENLSLTGTGDINGTGNTLSNTITGNDANNILDGGGGTNADKLIGGKGNDTYHVDLITSGTGLKTVIQLKDTITESIDSGTDNLILRGVITEDSFQSPITKYSTVILGANIENMDASATGATLINLTGNTLNNTISGNNSGNIIYGLGSNDTLYGLEGNDSLDGGGGNDLLDGGNGNDTLIGGTGIDTLIGGNGDDTYVSSLILSGSGGSATVILEDNIAENGDGADTLRITGTAALTNPSLIALSDDYANIEHLDISGTGSTKLNLTGNAADNYLTGNAAANTLIGSDGNDTLDGGAGADIMNGGDGDDTYYVDNSGDQIEDSDGNDTVVIKLTSGTYTLATGSAIENVTLFGTATIHATGNDVANRIEGNSAANNLAGGDGNDTLIGGAGGDTLNGGSGTDDMQGGTGNDTYLVDSSLDSFTEDTEDTKVGGIDTVKVLNGYDDNAIEAGYGIDNIDASQLGNASHISIQGNHLANSLTGGAGNDTITGDTGKDTLIGGTGDDTLVGGDDIDNLQGGTGDDSYYVNLKVVSGIASLEDSITDTAGSDTLYLQGGMGASKNSTIVLAAALEHLDASAAAVNGTVALNLTGNASANQIIGSNGNNSILGLGGDDVIKGRDGDDSIDGGEGNDSLEGGDDNDTLIGGKGGDTLIGGDGDDTYVVNMIQNGLGIALEDDIQEAANAGQDIIQLVGSLKLDSTITLAVNDYSNIEGIDISLTKATPLNLIGNTENNLLIGNSGTNLLIGDDGDDTLDGGAGIDTMRGGAGNDLYVVNTTDDVVDEEGNNDSNDSIQASISIDLTNTSYAGIEHVILTGTGALNAKGTNEGNQLTGNNGANKLEGLDGDDTLKGGIGNDTLDGGTGADSMLGGAGNDIYYVDDAGDSVTEESSNSQTGGIDLVSLAATYNSTSYTLSSYVENLDARLLTAGMALNGNESNNSIIGTSGHDQIYGLDGNDTLIGGDGNDTLVGGSGIDNLQGGAGNDTYYVNLKTSGSGSTVTASLEDSIKDTSGNDTLYLSGGTGTNKNSTIVLTADIENLNASSVDSNSNFINFTGNASGNSIIGSGGNNTILGIAGDDTLSGEDGNDALDGGAGNDILNGGNDNDTLVGGAGIDTLDGGNGDDVYVVGLKTQMNLGTLEAILEDVINENNSGNDTLKLTGSAKLTTASTISLLSVDIANIENIDASSTGSTLLNLTGNAQNNMLTGNAAANTLLGGDGDDYLNGGAGNDSLVGGDGNDTLEGGLGNDTLKGGSGDDLYIINALGDVINEEGNTDSNDSIQASISIDLTNTSYAGIEHVILTGTGALNAKGTNEGNQLTGNNGANKLEGLDGDDTLAGGLGNDTLTGGEGSDIFLFNTALSSKNIDTITDFTTGEDKIWLDESIFTGLSGGISFYLGTVKDAAGSGANLIYDNGKLYYDADGNGSVKAILFATLSLQNTSPPEINVGDFELF